MLKRIEKLIRQLEAEKADKNSPFSFSHLNKTKDIKTIMYWSIDSWPWSWENQLTRDIVDIIELYEKNCTFVAEHIFKNRSIKKT